MPQKGARKQAAGTDFTMGTATKHSPSPMEYDQAGEGHWRNGGVVPFMDPTKRSRWVWSLTALTSGKFSGVRPTRLLYGSTEVSSTAHVTSPRNAPEQTKRPVQDPFSHRETHIVRMTRRAVVFTGKECCFYDSDRPVSEKGYS